ncbi:hypothetical protein [Thermogemmatispora sp.]|nr:hypothetical protein [Thermogemmatispora sp.]
MRHVEEMRQEECDNSRESSAVLTLALSLPDLLIIQLSADRLA